MENFSAHVTKLWPTSSGRDSYFSSSCTNVLQQQQYRSSTRRHYCREVIGNAKQQENRNLISRLALVEMKHNILLGSRAIIHSRITDDHLPLMELIDFLYVAKYNIVLTSYASGQLFTGCILHLFEIDINTFLEIFDIGPFRLQQLSHYKPDKKETDSLNPKRLVKLRK